MKNDRIIVRGAREHNLKNIDVEIPGNSFTVITGLSGSGKSSLAFDTIYKEGQRRYLECLSSYAQQFIGPLEKPDVDLIEGLSPAISIEQKSTSANPRSTVGTITEIYDYLRLLYARIGEPFCYNCGKPVSKQSVVQIIETISKEYAGRRVTLLAPVVKGRKGHYRELFEQMLSNGFIRARIDGVIQELDKGFQVDRYKVHNIEVVVDRLKIEANSSERINTSVTIALDYGGGVMILNDGTNDEIFSKHLACFSCGISYRELSPASFSFNSKYGMCDECSGLGEKKELKEELIFPDPKLSINEGGIAPLKKPRKTWLFSQLESVGKRFGFTFDVPIGELTPEQYQVLLIGTKEKLPIVYQFSNGKTSTYEFRFTGIHNYLQHHFYNSSSPKIREWVEAFMAVNACNSCGGGRLKKESLAVKFGGLNLAELSQLSIRRAHEFFQSVTVKARTEAVALPIIKEIATRLEFLLNVGLDYLTLNRSAQTLSGGEAQRIRLATQIGTQLAGVLYVLDEPSIGLHQSDNIKLIQSLKRLRDLDNTVIVVEHDKETIEQSDYLIDLGPRAGEHGGEVCLMGYTKKLLKDKNGASSLTLDYLHNKRQIVIPETRRKGNGQWLVLAGARGNNLHSVTLRIPLGTLIAVTGVSGSGKSSLINMTLVPFLKQAFYQSKEPILPYTKVTGLESVDKVIEIDQSPIGRTPRSNPATYTGLFTFIRDLYASLPESKIRGYKVGRFSFNVPGGRCDKCDGDGLQKIELEPLPNVYIQCDVCHGRRFNRETLEVIFKKKSIYDVLSMTVEDALLFFEDHPRIRRKLQSLADVGLGYITLGQQATTLSGGEAQRVKLASELSKVSTGKTIYLLDEPTTGLHFEDVKVLLEVLNKLVEKGNTVVIIEHNLDVMKTADWIIDLGPGGGENGGNIIFAGTPEALAATEGNLTGFYLKRELESSIGKGTV